MPRLVRGSLLPGTWVVAAAPAPEPPGHPSGAIAGLLHVYYWSTLTFAAFRACTLASRVSHLVITPGPRRLGAAAALIGAGLGLAATQNLASGLRAGTGIGATGLSLALAGIAAIVLVTAHDLRRAR